MSKQKIYMEAKSAGKNHSLSDWLNLHEVSTKDAVSILEMKDHLVISDQRATCPREIWQSGISAQLAWKLSSNAIADSFPDLRAQVFETEGSCKVKFDQIGQPHTVDHGQHMPPDVFLDYQGRASDLIDVAHEFGHALQLVAKKNDFIPPVVREVAAFLGEMALLSHLGKLEHLAEKAVLGEWQRQNGRYLGRDLCSLQEALREPHTHYNYRQNYPPARILAFLLFHSVDRPKLTSIFQGKRSLTDCLNMVRHPAKANIMKNYFPEIPERDTDRPAIEAYRSLGMMTYLDLDYWQGQPEKPIEEYYGTLLKHMQSQTSYVVIGDENKPIGYATWNVADDDPDQIEVTRQAAPFGDHLHVQRSLRARLPNARMVSATHERSARKEQVAW